MPRWVRIMRGCRKIILYGCMSLRSSTQPPHRLRVLDDIIDLAACTNGGGTATAEEAAEMEVLASLLEQSDPGLEPAATGTMLDGEWDQIYTSNAFGITAGNGMWTKRELVGPLRGRVTQLVDSGRGEYRQRIQTRAGLVRGQLLASFTAVDTQSWAVTFKKFTVSVLRVPLRWRAASYQGTWTHTYVDADTRIMRTARATGGGEFLFILRRRR